MGPVEGVPMVRVLDGEGKEVLRGWYVYHELRKARCRPRPEDAAHLVAHCVAVSDFDASAAPGQLRWFEVTPPHRIEVMGRTCRAVPMDLAGSPPYRKGGWVLNALSDGCSGCGYPFDSMNRGMPNYCPNCGARVVSE